VERRPQREKVRLSSEADSGTDSDREAEEKGDLNMATVSVTSVAS
jgi:hypothetical protein